MNGWNLKNNIRKIVLNLETNNLIEFARTLRRMNISSAALFPGLDGFCRSLGEHLFHYKELAEMGTGKM